MLATAVLLAGCVHDTDDFQLFLAEQGVSLTYYVGDASSGEKDHSDPWDTILDKFGVDTKHTGKSDDGGKGNDDPWDTITEKFGRDINQPNKSDGGDAASGDPWDTIRQKFDIDSTHTGKKKKGDSAPKGAWQRIRELFAYGTLDSELTDDRRFLGVEKSGAVFLSFTGVQPTTFRAVVVEVRGEIQKLVFTDGTEQYIVGAPASWTEGTTLETGFVSGEKKKGQLFLGVRFWRTVRGGNQEGRVAFPAAELSTSWPVDNVQSGASLLVRISVPEKAGNDPWDTIGENFPIESAKGNDPWDSVRESFPLNNTKSEDPWDTIRTKFDVDSTHTGKKKGRSFRGFPISTTVFVSLTEGGGDGVKRLGHECVLPKKEGGRRKLMLKVVEVRGDVCRLERNAPFGGRGRSSRSLFAVGAPVEWMPGTVLESDVFGLGSARVLPVVGAVVWDLSPGPPPKERGDVSDVIVEGKRLD